jgi:hypothetical protein
MEAWTVYSGTGGVGWDWGAICTIEGFLDKIIY